MNKKQKVFICAVMCCFIYCFFYYANVNEQVKNETTFGQNVDLMNQDSNQLGQNVDLMNQDFNQLGQNVDLMNQDFNQLGQNVDLKNQDFNQLGQNVDSTNQDFNQLEQNVDSTNQDSNQLGQNVNSTNQDLNQLGQNVNSTNQDFNQLGQNVNSTNQDFNQLGQNVYSTNQDFNQLGQNVNSTNQDSNQLGQNVDSTNQESNQLGQNVNSTKQDSNQLGQNVNSTNQDFNQLGQNVNSTNQDFNQLGQNVNSTNRDSNQLGQNVNSTNQDFNQLAEDFNVKSNTPEQTECKRNIGFLTEPRPFVALASFPGSGNTWTRELLEDLTGIYTGSVFIDRLAYHPGSQKCPLNGEVFIVKTHYRKKIIDHLKCNDSVTYPKVRYSKTLFILRNPYDALISEFNRKRSGKVGTAKLEDYQNIDWELFVKQTATRWSDMIKYWTIRSDLPCHVIVYEQLMKHTCDELTKIALFLQVEDFEKKIRCTQCEGKDDHDMYKRKKPDWLKRENLFRGELRTTVNNVIYDILESNEFGFLHSVVRGYLLE